MKDINDQFLKQVMRESMIQVSDDFTEEVMGKIQTETSDKKETLFSTIEFQLTVFVLAATALYYFINPQFLKVIFQSLHQIIEIHYFNQFVTFLASIFFLIIVDIIIRKSKFKIFLSL